MTNARNAGAQIARNGEVNVADVMEIPAASETRIVRWIATVFYRFNSGIVDVQHDLEEIEDLQDLVEKGPHWDTIDHIHIVRSDKAYAELTVEQAEEIRG